MRETNRPPWDAIYAPDQVGAEKQRTVAPHRSAPGRPAPGDEYPGERVGWATAPSLEALADPAAAGVSVLPKSLVVDLSQLPGVPTKIEGMALVTAPKAEALGLQGIAAPVHNRYSALPGYSARKAHDKVVLGRCILPVAHPTC